MEETATRKVSVTLLALASLASACVAGLGSAFVGLWAVSSAEVRFEQALAKAERLAILREAKIKGQIGSAFVEHDGVDHLMLKDKLGNYVTLSPTGLSFTTASNRLLPLSITNDESGPRLSLRSQLGASITMSVPVSSGRPRMALEGSEGRPAAVATINENNYAGFYVYPAMGTGSSVLGPDGVIVWDTKESPPRAAPPRR